MNRARKALLSKFKTYDGLLPLFTFCNRPRLETLGCAIKVHGKLSILTLLHANQTRPGVHCAQTAAIVLLRITTLQKLIVRIIQKTRERMSDSHNQIVNHEKSV